MSLPTPTACEVTDEMLRAMLAVRMPATYRAYLHHPMDGPDQKKLTTERAAEAKAMFLAALRVAKPAETAMQEGNDKARWSFDDLAIGRLTESGSSLATRIIHRPAGLTNIKWYEHARAVCLALGSLSKTET